MTKLTYDHAKSKALRLEHGLSIAALASMSGTSVGTICRAESGCSDIYLSAAARIADVLGVPLDSLIRRDPAAQADKRTA